MVPATLVNTEQVALSRETSVFRQLGLWSYKKEAKKEAVKIFTRLKGICVCDH
jgi:hypothetical protein